MRIQNRKHNRAQYLARPAPQNSEILNLSNMKDKGEIKAGAGIVKKDDPAPLQV